MLGATDEMDEDEVVGGVENIDEAIDVDVDLDDDVKKFMTVGSELLLD